MKLTEEELKQMIADMIEGYRKENPEEEIPEPMYGYRSTIQASLRDVGLGYTPVGDGILMTEKGSVINTKSRQRPWVKLSQEMKDFAEALKVLIRSGGKRIEKVLEEQSDPSGGYAIVNGYC